MTSNSASWGGAVYAQADSTVTATDCTMTSNSAQWGGVYYTKDYSTVTATDCTMTSNSAIGMEPSTLQRGTPPSSLRTVR